MREVVDAYGQRSHDCGGAVPLSWGRDYEERWLSASDNADLGDAVYQYRRVLGIASSCGECRAEAQSAVERIEAWLA